MLSDKKIVCITGSVWTYKHNAPRHLLLKQGFLRPRWFTTGRAFGDADYDYISETSFQIAKLESRVLVHMEYGSEITGIMRDKFQEAMDQASAGVLVVGFPEIVAQIAESHPQAVIFAFKPEGSELSEKLDAAKRKKQLHRIDVDELEVGAWDEVMAQIEQTIDI